MAGTVRIVQGGLKAGSDATLEAYNEVSGHIKGVDASKEAARAGWQGQGSDAMYAAAMLWIEKATALNNSLLGFSDALKGSEANSGQAEVTHSAAFLDLEKRMTGGGAV